VVAIGSWTSAPWADAARAVTAAVAARPEPRPYVVHMGGGSTLTNPDGTMFLDTPGFPAEYLLPARGQADALAFYRTDPQAAALAWTYVSPPPAGASRWGWAGNPAAESSRQRPIRTSRRVTMSDRDQANDLHEAFASGPAATATTVSAGHPRCCGSR
jgi:hypothetical protein